LTAQSPDSSEVTISDKWLARLFFLIRSSANIILLPFMLEEFRILEEKS
jgi:hypothetical protein